MPSILHVLVVGFHHTKGCQIEYCFPSFAGSKCAADPDTNLPPVWSTLPSLAIPDQSHNSVDGVPLFGMVEEKLQLITQTYFEGKDFSKVELLEQMYTNLEDHFDKRFDRQFNYMGVSLEPLLRIFKLRTLELLKLILLEKKVIFELHPTSILSSVIVGLISLFPSLIESGLSEAAVYDDPDGTTEVDYHPNEHGFPLRIFTKRNLFLPYLSINGIDELRTQNLRAYCIGVTNGVFKHNSDLYDVYITIDQKGNGSIEYNENDLPQRVSLSTQDSRFMNNVLRTVSESSPADFQGNDDWVRMQFYLYLCAMFNAASKSNEHAAEYNAEFIRNWKQTENFNQWHAQSLEKLSQIDSAHPSTGPISAQDFISLVGHHFHQRTSALSTTASRLKNSFASWINRSNSRPSDGETQRKL